MTTVNKTCRNYLLHFLNALLVSPKRALLLKRIHASSPSGANLLPSVSEKQFKSFRLKIKSILLLFPFSCCHFVLWLWTFKIVAMITAIFSRFFSLLSITRSVRVVLNLRSTEIVYFATKSKSKLNCKGLNLAKCKVIEINTKLLQTSEIIENIFPTLVFEGEKVEEIRFSFLDTEWELLAVWSVYNDKQENG